jgi:hypothetical protein
MSFSLFVSDIKIQAVDFSLNAKSHHYFDFLMSCFQCHCFGSQVGCRASSILMPVFVSLLYNFRFGRATGALDCQLNC